MPPVVDSSAAAPVLSQRQLRRVLENRDLCRIISSHIPSDMTNGKKCMYETPACVISCAHISA
jgi:hypothetical protein